MNDMPSHIRHIRGNNNRQNPRRMQNTFENPSFWTDEKNQDIVFGNELTTTPVHQFQVSGRSRFDEADLSYGHGHYCTLNDNDRSSDTYDFLNVPRDMSLSPPPEYRSNVDLKECTELPTRVHIPTFEKATEAGINHDNNGQF